MFSRMYALKILVLAMAMIMVMSISAVSARKQLIILIANRLLTQPCGH